jgi:hypothetical protein
VREIRTLRAMWQVLETDLRTLLTGHEGGNAGCRQGVSYGFVAPALDPTRMNELTGIGSLDRVRLLLTSQLINSPIWITAKRQTGGIEWRAAF